MSALKLSNKEYIYDPHHCISYKRLFILNVSNDI